VAANPSSHSSDQHCSQEDFEGRISMLEKRIDQLEKWKRQDDEWKLVVENLFRQRGQ
jgi:hypothetical protein